MITNKDAEALRRAGTTLEHIEALSSAAALIHFGAHLTIITELTGLPPATVTRLARTLIVNADGRYLMRTGRLPRSLNDVIATPSRHLECSYFYRVYLNCLGAYDRSLSSMVHAPSLIKAYSDVRAMFSNTDLLFATALLTVRQGHKGEIELTPCKVCKGYSIQVVPADPSGYTCPVCKRSAELNDLDQNNEPSRIQRNLVNSRLKQMSPGELFPKFRMPALATVIGTREAGAFKPPR